MGELTLEYLRGGVATYMPGERFGPRVLVDYEMVWIIEGQARYTHGDATVDAPAGSIIFARPGVREAYAWDPKRQTRHGYFHFGIAAAPTDWPPLETWPVVRRMSSGDAVRPLFRRVLDRWCHRRDLRDQTPTPTVCRLVAALLDAFREVEEAPAAASVRRLPDAVGKALRWTAHRLEREPDAPMTLEELAAHAEVSPSHLVRLFNRSLGHTPMRTLQLMRLEQAMTLLQRSNLNVSQIAHRCGFASPYHFSRAFKRTYGLSPRAMRQRFEHGDARPAGPLPIDAPSLGA